MVEQNYLRCYRQFAKRQTERNRLATHAPNTRPTPNCAYNDESAVQTMQHATTNTEPRASAAATHRPYCACQCGMRISPAAAEVTIDGDAEFPVNQRAQASRDGPPSAGCHIPNGLALHWPRGTPGTLAQFINCRAAGPVSGILRSRGTRRATELCRRPYMVVGAAAL